MEEIRPPQPIPYPNNPLIKSLYRLPIPLYRLGLGALIGKYILVVSTFGRKSGKIRRTPVEYHRHKGRIYVISGFGNKPDWFQNLQKNPHAGLNIGSQRFCAAAHKPETTAEWEGAMAFLKSSPVAQLSEPGLAAQLEDGAVQEMIKNWPILIFEPSDDPCPPPLETDLAWAWPLILLAGAWILLAAWLHHHKNKSDS